MATLVNVCQRMISIWSIWYTDRYSLSTLSPLKRVHFIIWKHLMRKEYMVILMYHYSHRFVQHASADIFLQRYLRHCKRQTQGWKSSSNGVERIFSFPCSLPYWMPALLKTAKNILQASWKTCWQKGKKSERMVQMDESIRKQLEKPQTWFCKYFPKRIQNVGEKEIADRQLVYDFKDGRSHEAVAQMTAARMIEEHGSGCSQLVFIPVPASSVRKNEIRYMDFCRGYVNSQEL